MKASPHILKQKNCSHMNFGESLCIVTFFISSGSRRNLSNGFNFHFGLFWMAWHWKPVIRKIFCNLESPHLNATNHFGFRVCNLQLETPYWCCKRVLNLNSSADLSTSIFCWAITRGENAENRHTAYHYKKKTAERRMAVVNCFRVRFSDQRSLL